MSATRRSTGIVQVGDALPAMVIDVTPTRVVAGAIASRDFMPVHHDRDYANQQGAPDIFMNILSDTGYCSRFLTDWAGPDAMIQRLAIRLGVPVFPGHTLTYTGEVTAVERNGDETIVDVDVAGDERARRARRRHRASHCSGRIGAVTSGGLSGRAAIAGIGQTEFSKESGRTELQLACEAVHAALDDAGLDAADVDGLVTFTMDTSEEMEVARNLGIARAVDVHARPLRRRRVGGDRDAGRDGGGDRRRRRRRLLPRVQRALGQSLRRQRAAQVTTLPLWLVVVRAVRTDDARRRGSRCTRVATWRRYGVTNADFGRIAVVDRVARRDQSRRLVLRAADHARGPPGVAVDRRARAAAARLLPGERRRRRDRRDLGRTGARPAPAAGDHHGCRAGRDLRRRDDDELLPRRPRRAARDGRGRPAPLGACPASRPPTCRPRSCTTTSRRSC